MRNWAESVASGVPLASRGVHETVRRLAWVVARCRYRAGSGERGPGGAQAARHGPGDLAGRDCPVLMIAVIQGEEILVTDLHLLCQQVLDLDLQGGIVPWQIARINGPGIREEGEPDSCLRQRDAGLRGRRHRFQSRTRGARAEQAQAEEENTPSAPGEPQRARQLAKDARSPRPLDFSGRRDIMHLCLNGSHGIHDGRLSRNFNDVRRLTEETRWLPHALTSRS